MRSGGQAGATLSDVARERPPIGLRPAPTRRGTVCYVVPQFAAGDSSHMGGDEGVPEGLDAEAVDAFGDELRASVEDPAGHS